MRGRTDDLMERLRRCTHHTMRVRGEPCAHWECVARNEAADEIERLRTQAAEDIIWMSGPVSTPAADLAAWHEIQDRWLRKAPDE